MNIIWITDFNPMSHHDYDYITFYYGSVVDPYTTARPCLAWLGPRGSHGSVVDPYTTQVTVVSCGL